MDSSSSSRFSYGIIDLHRALVVIEEGLLSFAKKTLRNPKQNQTYADYGFDIREILSHFQTNLHANWLERRVDLAEELSEKSCSQQSEPLRATLSRIKILLRRAENLLMDSRKNVWWISILLQSRLRFAHLGLLSDCVTENRALSEGRSFFASEFCRASDVSIAESSALDLLRIARLDIVRIAKACMYYANCFNAAMVLILRSDEYEKHKGAVRSMFLTGNYLYDQFLDRYEQRLSLNESTSGGSTLDKSAIELCEDVKKRFNRQLNQVKLFVETPQIRH